MNNFSKIQKMILTATLFMLAGINSFAAGADPAPATSTAISSDTLMRYVLGGVIVLLVIIVAVLSNAIRIAGSSFQQKLRNEKDAAKKVMSLTLLFSLVSSTMFAQTATDQAATGNSFGNWDVYLFVGIVLLLFIVILVLVRTLFVLMGIKRTAAVNADGTKAKVRTWFQKFNETVPIEDEDSLDMSHNYDGIRELDNKVPSWWNWAFMAGVFFSIIYLYRMFISETLPNQFQELAQANEVAATEKLAWLKKGANNVDENNVKMLGAAEMADGAVLYAKNCVACHGDKGQGGVGPNLTDDYWIHKGGIKDIFYTIKYGWAEKGMKSWKEDFSPVQIAQISSFVKSLHGTNPPGAKDKQGELYTEEVTTAAPADSTAKATPADSAAIKK